MGKKEPRETQRWLKLIQRVPLIKKPELPLVPKLWLGNGLTEAGASAQVCSQAGAWEQEERHKCNPVFHSMFDVRRSSLKTTQRHKCNP
jgi:hypothetical protein